MPRIDFLILANHAEVRDGLINLLGGGWNHHRRTIQRDGRVAIAHFGIAVGVNFDADDDTTHADIWIRVRSEDGRTEVVRVDGSMDVQTQDHTASTTRLGIIALNVDIQWPRPGIYQLVAGLGSTQEPERRVIVSVEDHQLVP